MSEIPEFISDIFEQLKKEYNEPLTLKRIGNGFYVYTYFSQYDEKKHKIVVKTYYIGTINEQSGFIAARKRKLENVTLTKNIISAIRTVAALSEKDQIILRNLSMNAKMARNEIAKRAGMSEASVASRIKRLTEDLDIKYFAELNLKKLNFLRYIIFVKFKEKIPSIDIIKEAFENDPRVLLVAMLKGQYDLMIYIALENDIAIMDFIYEWRSKKLTDYDAKWFITPFSQVYGGVRVREQFFELLKERVWHRSKEQPHKLPWQLSKAEFGVLKELSIDSNRTFKEISEKLGFLNPEDSNYAYEKLKERGIIERLTISMQNLPIKYHGLFYLKILNYSKYKKYRREVLEDNCSFKYKWINKYSIIGDISTPDGVIRIAPILNDDDFYIYKENLSKFEGTALSAIIITDIIIGSIFYRNFDNEYSKYWQILINEFTHKQEKKIEY
ncbi:MAG: AsnC family transcriptional regulator [Candidatus Micrarchaeia archaeon]